MALNDDYSNFVERMGSFEDALSDEDGGIDKILAHIADKSKTIKGATDKELDELLIRLRKEAELQNLVGELRRRSTPQNTSGYYDPPASISTDEPIESLYHDQKAEETLKHFGIPGMHWGVRREGSRKFVGPSRPTVKEMTDKQLIEGSRRGALEKNYNKSQGGEGKGDKSRVKTGFETGATLSREGGNIASTLNRRKEQQIMSENKATAKKMSDEDLRKAIARMNMEQQYSQLTTRDVSAGKSRAEDILAISGSILTSAAAVAGLALTIKQLSGK